MSPFGARVVRIDRPARAIVCIELGIPGPNVLLLSTVRSAEGIGAVRRRPRGVPVDAFGLLLRKRLASARVAAIEGDRNGSRVVFTTEGGLVVLEARHDRDARGFSFVGENGAVVSATYAGAIVGDDRPPIDESALAEAGSAIAESVVRVADEARARAIRDALDRAITKSERTIAAIHADAARADAAPGLRREADLLMAAATDDRPGRDAIPVLDFHADPPAETTIAIDPREGPRTAANRRYHLARKLERGVAIAAERAKTIASRLDELRAMRSRLDDPDDRALDEADSLLESLGRKPIASPGKSKSAQPTHRPYRAYQSERGLPLWVGKNAADNDALTIVLGKPHHLFVHVRGRPGSHVLVVLPKGGVCDEQTLVDAATLAAHFSTARGESPVEIVYAERRHVRKPKGSAPGSVRVDREKTMLLRFEPARLARLVATER